MKRAMTCMTLILLAGCGEPGGDANDPSDKTLDVKVGAAVAGNLSEAPDPLVFPTAFFGDGVCGDPGARSCTYASVTITNTSASVSETIDSGSTSSSAFWVTWGGTCNTATKTLAPGTSCTLELGFMPTGYSNSLSGTASVTFVSGTVLTFAVSGKSAPAISIAPSPLVFPPTNAGAISYAMITMTNNTGDPQTITTATTAAPFWVTWGGTCNTATKTLASHASCTLQWGFQPPAPAKSYAHISSVSFASGLRPAFVVRGTSN